MISLKEYSLLMFHTITLEVTTVCNLKCPTCRVTQSGQTPRFMEFNQFANIAQALRSCICQAQIFSLMSSEPLLHKRFFDMIDFIQGINPKIQTAIVTNGMLLDDEKQNGLLQRGIISIGVSLDGATKETHESIRVGSKFETIIENTKSFIRKGGRVRTIQVSRKENIGELLDFVDMCADIGIWCIKISGLNAYKPEHVSSCLYSYEGNPEVEEIYRQAEEKAKQKHILFTYKPTKLNPSACCTVPHTMYVGIDGDISPCVFYSEPSPLSLLDKTTMTEPIIWGNVLEEEPLRIWYSDASLQFCRKLMYGEECKACAMKYGVIC